MTVLSIGETDSNVAPSSESTHSPSMKCRTVLASLPGGLDVVMRRTLPVRRGGCWPGPRAVEKGTPPMPHSSAVIS